MFFKETEKSTDAAKWCENHGFTVDSERLTSLKEKITLEDLPDVESYQKTQVAIMSLLEGNSDIKKKVYKLERKSIREKAENGFLQYPAYETLAGYGDTLEILAAKLDICALLNFEAKRLTVYIDLKQAKNQIADLETLAAEEAERLTRAEKELKAAKEALATARQDVINYTVTCEQLQDSKTSEICNVLKASIK